MKKNGNPQKGIFILFLFYSVASFLSFAIFINSCSDTILKNIALFQHTKKHPFRDASQIPDWTRRRGKRISLCIFLLSRLEKL
jgi:putative membrane protein